jgi:Bacteriophage tail tube protein
MATFPLLTMEAANIFCGVEAPSDPTQSNHLRLTDVKLPGMDEQYVDHRAAGAPVAIEIDTVFARLESTFTLAGWSTDVAALIGQWGQASNQFWIFGALRDRVTGNVLQGKAAIFGRLGRADPNQWRRGDVSHWSYALKGITRYNLSVGGDPVYEFDYYNNIFNIAGSPVTQAVNQALNLI